MDTKDVPAGLKNAMHAQSTAICSEAHWLKAPVWLSKESLFSDLDVLLLLTNWFAFTSGSRQPEEQVRWVLPNSLQAVRQICLIDLYWTRWWIDSPWVDLTAFDWISSGGTWKGYLHWKPGSWQKLVCNGCGRFFPPAATVRTRSVFYSRKIQRELQAVSDLLPYLVLFVLSVILHLINKIVL